MNINTYDGRLKNSNIPFINLSKENLILIYDSLEAEQAGNMLFKLAEYLYQGTEPSFETKIENSVWNNIMLLINRKAEGYFVKAAAARENGKKGGRPKKTVLQDIVETEFDIAPVTNNIPNNEEIENKPVLSPQIIQDDQYQEEVESSSNDLKMGNNEIIENNIEDMGNFIGYIKEPVQVAATAHTPNAFQDFLKESAFTINDIIEDFKAGGIRAKIQAPDRLKTLLNTKLGKVYKEEIEEYIKARVNTPNKADLSPSNIKEVEEPQPIRDNASESLKIAKNEVKQSITLRVAASEDFRPSEKLQDLINTDNEFCSIYTRCINYITDYKLNPNDFVKSNSKNIAFSKLQRIFEEYGIPFNEDIKNFINDDVSAKITRLQKIA